MIKVAGMGKVSLWIFLYSLHVTMNTLTVIVVRKAAWRHLAVAEGGLY